MKYWTLNDGTLRTFALLEMKKIAQSEPLILNRLQMAVKIQKVSKVANGKTGKMLWCLHFIFRHVIFKLL
jgi:hypothetical protein